MRYNHAYRAGGTSNNSAPFVEKVGAVLALEVKQP